MKKIIFIFAVAVATSFMSCGNKVNNVNTNDTVLTDTTDTVSTDSVLAQ